MPFPKLTLATIYSRADSRLVWEPHVTTFRRVKYRVFCRRCEAVVEVHPVGISQCGCGQQHAYGYAEGETIKVTE